MPLYVTKPTVGASVGTWGGSLNADLDAIKAFVDILEQGGRSVIGIGKYSPAGAFADDSTPVASMLSESASEAEPNSRFMSLEGRVVTCTGISLPNYGKLIDGFLFRFSGTAPQITMPSQATLQVVRKSVIDNVMIDGNPLIAGNIGVSIGNHASAELRDVRVQNEATGVKIDGGQFLDFYGFKTLACTLGADIRSKAASGGGNSITFYSPQILSGTVGMVVQDGSSGAFPVSSNKLIQPQFLSNGVCNLALFGVLQFTVEGWYSEYTGAGASTASVAGKTVKKSSAYLSGSNLIVKDGMVADATVNPVFLLESGSHLSLAGMTGYGQPAGTLVEVDSTSSVELSGQWGCIGVVQGATRVDVDITSAQGTIVGPASVGTRTDLPNAIGTPSQNPGFSSTTGTSATTTGSDALIGSYDQVTYAASAGSESTNRITRTVTGAGAVMCTVNVLSTTDTVINFGRVGDTNGQRPVRLFANRWQRIIWWQAASSVGAINLCAYPTGTAGPILRFARWQVLTATDGPELRAQWNAAAAGSYRST